MIANGITGHAAARRLAGLRRRAAVAALGRAASRRGSSAWIVGGAVRDALLGAAAAEIDVAVSSDAEGLARELERAGRGRAVFLSRDRPGPTVYRVAGSPPLDIAELEGGSIEADLGRRDFTVNALAVEVRSGALLDPFGGITDLRRRRLRCVREENLAEDPLRVLRAARLIATHGLTPDAAALAAARRAASLFSRAAPERVGAELSKLLGSPAASPALLWAARAGVLGATLGLEMGGTAPAALARSLAVLDDRGVRRMPPERRRRLRLARIALRLGMSPEEARRWLQGRRWARAEAQDAAALCGAALASHGVRTRRDAWAWALTAGRLAPDAIALLARLAPADRRRARRLTALTRRPPPRVPVDGDDVVAWTGVRPGPEVGRLLAAVRVAAAMGEVRNRREARHWLTVQVPNSP